MAHRRISYRALVCNVFFGSLNLPLGSRGVYRWIFFLSSSGTILHSIRRLDGIAWNSGFDCGQGEAAALCRRTLGFEFILVVYGRYVPVRIAHSA